MSQELSERGAFEAFQLARKNRGAKREAMFACLPDGTYMDESVQRHWWTWQNARAAQTERPTEQAGPVDIPGEITRAYGACSIGGPAEDVAFILRHLPDVDDATPTEPVELNAYAINDKLGPRAQQRTSFENVQDVLAAIKSRYGKLYAALTSAPKEQASWAGDPSTQDYASTVKEQAEPVRAVCASCNGAGVIGTPGAACPFCKLGELGAAHKLLATQPERLGLCGGDAVEEALYVLTQATSFATKKARDGHAKAVAALRAHLSRMAGADAGAVSGEAQPRNSDPRSYSMTVEESPVTAKGIIAALRDGDLDDADAAMWIDRLVHHHAAKQAATTAGEPKP